MVWALGSRQVLIRLIEWDNFDMWIIQCSITGEYTLDSKSKIALENITNIEYAKRYATLSGAKSARSFIQGSYDYWDETHKSLCDRGIQEYVEQGRDYYVRKFEIREI